MHRLVRISPYDANARRQTSFASVLVKGSRGVRTEIVVERLRAEFA